MKITRQQIEAMAKHRLPGYVDAVLAVAVIDGDTVTISAADADRLRKQYRPPRPADSGGLHAGPARPCGNCRGL